MDNEVKKNLKLQPCVTFKAGILFYLNLPSLGKRQRDCLQFLNQKCMLLNRWKSADQAFLKAEVSFEQYKKYFSLSVESWSTVSLTK